VYGEWQGKPAVIITYGAHGGSKCAVQMRAATTMPAITLTRAMIGGGPIDPARDFSAAADAVRQAIGELSAALADNAARPFAR
jgi:hypothetical protein